MLIWAISLMASTVMPSSETECIYEYPGVFFFGCIHRCAACTTAPCRGIMVVDRAVGSVGAWPLGKRTLFLSRVE